MVIVSLPHSGAPPLPNRGPVRAERRAAWTESRRPYGLSSSVSRAFNTSSFSRSWTSLFQWSLSREACVMCHSSYRARAGPSRAEPGRTRAPRPLLRRRTGPTTTPSCRGRRASERAREGVCASHSVREGGSDRSCRRRCADAQADGRPDGGCRRRFARPAGRGAGRRCADGISGGAEGAEALRRPPPRPFSSSFGPLLSSPSSPFPRTFSSPSFPFFSPPFLSLRLFL